MPTFARSGSGSGKWHIVGPDGCRYGRQIVPEDGAPDETVSAADIVAYESPNVPENAQAREKNSQSPEAALSLRGNTHDQRLVFPAAIRESDTDCCALCRQTLENHQKRRSAVISELKAVTPRRNLEWDRTEDETRRACDWCRASEYTTFRSEALETTVCPVCRRLFETPLGEPANGDSPEGDRLPDTPTDQITPIVFGTDRPEFDPSELVGSNRPVLKFREKHTNAELVLELERTGHGFAADGIAALEEIRAEYTQRTAEETDVRLDIGTPPRTATLKGIRPTDRLDVVTDCCDAIGDPGYWFPLGWPEQGYVHRRGSDPTIPGTDPVVEAFPRVKARQSESAVETDILRSLTEPGRYQRGERYYERGAVTDVERVDDELRATVRGSRPYDVQVTLSNDSYVEGQCSCPDDATPCKHIVAAVLASGDVDVIGADRPLREVLESTPPAELRKLLRTLAEDDVSVRKRIYEELSDEENTTRR
ncbi:hypothetical protein GS429_03935 [Natronorubrum sp. JWXQ-INN-674]|uniref:SWIM-type domain-containing protein n=1 Tax=Natronorubrum halalkaliphilum TaxID=2691917 RepID=A0A6B0VI80_9EURY|nr:SWIM zinc finger family protein [Natronorubrum halalkaliphilum]MXV61224.1 hypothetical protein [Natronorubrum halalkaliphilum]